MQFLATADGLRLIETRGPNDATAWESIWTGRSIRCEAAYPGTLRIAALTREFLPEGSKVLDGGCGLGDKVLAFRGEGLEGYGVDTARRTLAVAKAQVPDLRLIVADVRALPFSECFFDGYWSLGVIEHFFEGFEKIGAEICRTLRPGGVLFLSVPTLNVTKRRRLARGDYAMLESGKEAEPEFWQYYFSDAEILAKFRDAGFRLELTRRAGAYYGIKNDHQWLRPALNALETRAPFLSRLLIRACNVLLSRWLFHTTIFVFRRVSRPVASLTHRPAPTSPAA